MARILPETVTIDVVDVGANPIDHAPPYQRLLPEGLARVVGFEPNREALEKLNARKSASERYFPYALGDGSERDFHVCAAAGMSSLLRPDPKRLSYFHGLPEWGQVTRTERVQTYRLDDLAEVSAIDLLKIDVQGAELEIFRHGTQKLSEALAIHSEVAFFRIYENQPLFSDVDLMLRGLGFQFHRFAHLISRVLSPLMLNNDPHAGLSQAFKADAVFIRDLTRFGELRPGKLLKLAVILHDLYGSYDVAYEALATYDDQVGTQIGDEYLRRLTGSSGGPGAT